MPEQNPLARPVGVPLAPDEFDSPGWRTVAEVRPLDFFAALDDEAREALADRVHEHIQSLVIDTAIDARAIVDALCGGPDA